MDKYISKVEKIIKRKPRITDSQIRELLKKYHEVAMHLIFTYTDSEQENILMFFPEDVSEEDFLHLIFCELAENTTELIKISCCQMYYEKGMKLLKFSIDRNGKYYFNVDVNPDEDTRHLNKLRLAFIAELNKSHKTSKKGGSKKETLEDIYWNYVDHAESKGAISDRFEQVYKRALSKTEDAMEFKVTAKLISSIYGRIDRVFFDGKIAPYLEKNFGQDLECAVAGRLRSTAGLFSFGDDGRTPTLQISDKVIAKIFSNGEKSIGEGNGIIVRDRLSFLIRTIEHELCHLLVIVFDYKNGIISKGHGPAFQKFILHTFGHTQSKHYGFSGDLELSEEMKENLRPGNTVEYINNKGIVSTGKVIKLYGKYAHIQGCDRTIIYGHIKKILDSGTEPLTYSPD